VTPIEPAADSRCDAPTAPVAGEVHLWLCDLDALSDPERLEWCRTLLDADECLRHQRFAFEQHRHRYLVSHALLRWVLALYSGRKPESWEFVKGEHGKPRLAPSQCRFAPAFNLSHSGSLALLALGACSASLGVDLEQHLPERDFLSLARRNFAPEEANRLRGLCGDSLAREFYDLWTLKEAFVKARGDGLTQSLADFWFDLDRVRRTISFDARSTLESEPARWAFWSFRLDGPYSAAVALRASSAMSPGVPRWFTGVPGRDWSAVECQWILASTRITAN